MTASVRVGVIGTSFITDAIHLPNLKSHPQADVVALCGRNRERATELAAKYTIPQVFTDYQDMLTHVGLDAVVIATPDDQHYPMAMAALDAGLHVLCEKPLALTQEQAETMYEKAEAAGVKHMTFFTYRWVPQYQYARELIEQGYVGRPFHCSVRYVSDYGRGPDYSWQFDRQRTTGALGNLGSHAIDLARWFCGDIVRVSAHLGTYVTRAGPEGGTLDPANDAAVPAVEYANGAHGTIQVSAVAQLAERGQEQHVILHGEQGTLEPSWPLSLGAVLLGAKQGEERFQELQIPTRIWGDVEEGMPFWDRWISYLRTQSVGDRLFIDCILEDRPVVPSLYEGWKAQQVMAAAVESDRTGRWVAVG